MEIDPSNAEKPDQLRRGSDDQESLGYVRSYRCSFCKRGFSNAQALGGHMNIHRRDRARLKEFSSHHNNIPFLEITKWDSLNQPSSSVDIGDSMQQEFSRNETSCTPKRASASSDPEVDTDPEDQLQLSLFTEASSTNNDKEGNDRVTGEHAKGSMQSSHGESLPELDLELRLGTEPPEASRNG